jgi:uncharacterized beta-barrel protein YwiB (DUF1934 family)
MLKKVNLNIITERFPVGDVLLDPLPEGTLSEEQYAKLLQRSKQAEQNRRDAIRSEMTTPARMRLTEDWFSLSYTESADSDMAGSETQISFHRASPGTVTLLRSGDVRTALVFEQGVRHRCAYTTPFMPFEVGVLAKKVENHLLALGTLSVHYIVEIRGAEAECCHLTISMKEISSAK